jgi:hypothetical protein
VTLNIRSFVVGALFCAVAQAQFTLPPGITHTATYSTPGLNLPPNLGGIDFSSDGQTLYCGTSANSAAGEVRAVPVQRDPVTNRITGFGQATVFCPAPGIDGGLQFGPSGTLFWTTYSGNQLGERAANGNSATYALGPLGVASSTGSLAFVPAGLPNAGDLLVASYNAGDIYTVPLTANGDGTFTPATAALFAALPGGSEGIRYVPSGPFAGSIAVVNYGIGNISLLVIDPLTGTPQLDGLGNVIFTPFISGIPSPEGLAFDPLTNDFFVSQFGTAIYQFSGFPALPSIGICGAGTVGLGSGGPYDVVTVNGSAGGPARRVDIGFNVGITLTVATPPTSPSPVGFVLYGKLSDLDSSELTHLNGIGDLCFVPVHLCPCDPDIFVVASSLIPNDPFALVPSTFTPWTFTFAPGLPFPFTLVFQGALSDPSQPLGYATTNAVILNIL